MMEALAEAMDAPDALQSPRRHRRLWRGLGLLACLLLGGCSSLPPLPRMLYMAIGLNDDEAIDTGSVNDFRARLQLLETSFQALHPGTHFQFSLTPEVQIESVLQQRSTTGLAPDLAFVNGDTARHLLESGVVDPYPISRKQQALIDPRMLVRLRDARGRLAGLPVMVRTQLACFNRKRMKQSPANVDALLRLSNSNQSIGLTIDPVQLLWSVGSLGALKAIERAVAGQPATAADQAAVEGWLRWLEAANNQRQITFYATQPQAMADFEAGHLDWITCDSVNLASLAKTLGSALGVAPLPSGPGGRPSPVNRLRVLVLGRSSTASGRQRALAFADSSISAESQSNLTIGSQSVLPANRFVQVPIRGSQRLAALVASAQDGAQTANLAALIHSHDPRLRQIQRVLTELVFGDLPERQASRQLLAILRQSTP